MNRHPVPSPRRLRSQLAAVDLGSNTFRLVIGRVEHSELGDQVQAVDELRETVRLAAGLGMRRELSAEARDRAVQTLQRFGERLRGFRREEVRAVATNTFRVASNTRSFLAQAEAALGFPIEVIGGREEARLIYLGAAHALPADGRKRLVIDIGGGSTECIVGVNYDTELLESVGVGSVALSLRSFADGTVRKASLREARLHAREAFAGLAKRYRDTAWLDAIGTSGTTKALWQVGREHFGANELSRPVLEACEQVLLEAGHVDRVRLTGLKPDRRPVLAGGLAVMQAVFDEFGIESMRYCDAALREGVLYDLLGRARGTDMREVTVTQMIRRYGVDTRQAEHVAQLAHSLLALARSSADTDGAHQHDDQLLGWAARLHEVGRSISHEDFHKHGSYILTHCDMPGFSRHEQARLAWLVLGQTGGLAKLESTVVEPSDWLPVLCLRLAVIIHRRRDGRSPPSLRIGLRQGRVRLELPQEWIAQHPLTHHSLQREVQTWDRIGPFEAVDYLPSA